MTWGSDATIRIMPVSMIISARWITAKNPACEVYSCFRSRLVIIFIIFIDNAGFSLTSIENLFVLLIKNGFFLLFNVTAAGLGVYHRELAKCSPRARDWRGIFFQYKFSTSPSMMIKVHPLVPLAYENFLRCHNYFMSDFGNRQELWHRQVFKKHLFFQKMIFQEGRALVYPPHWTRYWVSLWRGIQCVFCIYERIPRNCKIREKICAIFLASWMLHEMTSR